MRLRRSLAVARPVLRVLPRLDPTSPDSRIVFDRSPHIAREGRTRGVSIKAMSEGALTYADLAAMPDDAMRHELIDGELVVSPSPKLRHQRLSWRLVVAFGPHIEAHGGGEMFHAPADVVLSDTNVVVPDLFLVADSQRQILTANNVQGSPDLVIEIVSESRYDRVRKRDLYAGFGVPEYWIVDPDADRMEVYRLEGAAYAKPQIFEAGDTLTFAGLPGFQLNLTKLFAR